MGKPVAVLETDYYQIMHAEDFSNNLFLLLDNKEASYNEIYNITGDEMVSSYFIIMTLSMFMKIPVNIVCVNETYVEKFFDSRNYAELLSSVNCFLGHCYSNSKIKQVISYHSNIRICEKCNEIIEYFCKYQEYIMWDKINEIKIEEMLRLYIAGGGNVRILNNQIDQYASCVLQMYRNLYNRIETSINMMNKEIVNKEYLGKWLENKIKMSERISDKLKRMGITDVCIYGYGILGKLLLQELLKDGIQVKAIIDKQLYHLKEIKDIPIEKNVEGHETDCIIVSVMTDYENIYSYLLEHNCKKIISLNQLLLKKEEILDDNATY
jgi:hypothetical protein